MKTPCDTNALLAYMLMYLLRKLFQHYNNKNKYYINDIPKKLFNF